MKKLISVLILLIFFSLAVLIFILSTFGIETNKFNNSITNRVSETKNIDLELDTIKFKIDEQENLFLNVKKNNLSPKEQEIRSKRQKAINQIIGRKL